MSGLNGTTRLVELAWVQYSIGVAYGVVFVGSVLGNVGVIGVVAAKRGMRSVTNIFIASSATADLLVTLSSFWTTPAAYVLRQFPYGEWMCYASTGLGGGCMFWSPYVIMAIAVDRYTMVTRPLQRRINQLEAVLVVVIIWICSALVLIPQWYHLQYHDIPTAMDGERTTLCLEVWSSDVRKGDRLVYGVTVLLIRSVLPCVVICLCHLGIACRLRAQEQRFKEHRTVLAQTNEEERKNKLERLLSLMVFIFVLCSFPWDLYNIYQDYRDMTEPSHRIWRSDLEDVTFLTSFLVAMTGTLLNPLVYAWWNENFKREIHSAVDCSQRKLSRGAASMGLLSRRRGEGEACGTALRRLEPVGPPSAPPKTADAASLKGEPLLPHDRPRCATASTTYATADGP